MFKVIMRLHWVDSLKGIGIFLVVFAHHSLPQAIDTYIFSFHMPLFFFISGFLFNFGKYAESAADFVKGRVRSLIVPYFFFALLTCLFYYLLDTAFQPHVTNIEFFEATVLYMIHAILYALGPTVSYNPPLWFLPCLFVTELLFYGAAKKYYWKPGMLMFWLTAAAIFGYLYAIYMPFRLLWSADVALTAVVFYGAGNLFRKLTESKTRSAILLEIESNSISGLQATSRFQEAFFRIEKFLPLFFILMSLFYFGYLLEFPTDKINMNVLRYGNFFSFYFLAFSGIFAFVYLFKNLGSSKILEFYGKNSLIVLALHFPLKDVLTKLAVIIFGMGLECFYCKTAFALGLTVLNLLCLVPLIFLINNYLPFLLGKRGSPASLKTLNERLRKLVD